MRSRRLLPLAVLLTSLALASPAMGADRTVSVVDFEFQPREVQIEPGDTITWNFVNGGHTTTAAGGQPERWNSGGDTGATSPAGAIFQHTFATPGRFNYFCIPHASFMKGVVVVGEDEFPKSQSRFRQVRRGNRITFKFTLVEPAKVVAKLRGPSRRSATRRRLAPGSHSIAFRRLRDGTYRGTVAFTDDFDNVSRVKTFTVIR